jgi:hypothetical protein
MRQIPVILGPTAAREPDEALAVSSGSRSEPGRMAPTASKDKGTGGPSRLAL